MSKHDKSTAKSDKTAKAATAPAQKRRPGQQRYPQTAGSASRPGRAAAAGPPATADGAASPGHILTINVPVDEVVEVAAAPVKMAARVLTAKGGLPLYGGLGILAIAQIIDWPVAAAAGIGYAVLRRWGPLRPGRAAAPSRPGGEPGHPNGKAPG